MADPRVGIAVFYVALFGGLALSAYLAWRLRGWYLPVGVVVAILQQKSAEKSGLGMLRGATDGIFDVVLWPSVVLTYVLVGSLVLLARLFDKGETSRDTRTQAGPRPAGVGDADHRAGPTVH